MRIVPLVAVLAACAPPDVDVEEDELAADVPAELQAPAPSPALSVASWNVQWFGSAANGPSDEPLQAANVRAAMEAASLDVWGLSEVVSEAQLAAVLSGLPGYRAFVATNAVDGPAWYAPNEQKVALLWKESAATLVSARLVATASAYDFAGRPPLEVTLELSSGAPLVVLVLHMKAFGDADSAARRQRAAEALRLHLQTLGGADFAVIGDWNDDVGGFAALEAEFDFTTAPLSAAGERSTVNGRRMIDHHLASTALSARMVQGSAAVLHPAIADYGSTTSDHYPVVTRYAVGRRVRMVEVLANEPGSDRRGERVVLENGGSAPVDLSGWTLSDATAVRHAFPAGTVIAPGTQLAMRGGDASSGTLSLNNPADAVVLRDASRATVDQLAWSEPQADGVAITR